MSAGLLDLAEVQAEVQGEVSPLDGNGPPAPAAPSRARSRGARRCARAALQALQGVPGCARAALQGHLDTGGGRRAGGGDVLSHFCRVLGGELGHPGVGGGDGEGPRGAGGRRPGGRAAPSPWGNTPHLQEAPAPRDPLARPLPPPAPVLLLLGGPPAPAPAPGGLLCPPGPLLVPVQHEATEQEVLAGLQGPELADCSAAHAHTGRALLWLLTTVCYLLECQSLLCAVLPVHYWEQPGGRPPLGPGADTRDFHASKPPHCRATLHCSMLSR